MDDLKDDQYDRGEIEDQLQLARDRDAVTFIHTHSPGKSVTIAALERLFDGVEENGLEYITFPELVPGPARAGLALSFDDAYIYAWDSIRDLLRQRGVRATFFITRIHTFDDEQLQILAGLASDGHAIEAHGVLHLDAKQYVCEHGPRKYIDSEAIPSILRLRDLGYPVTAFAFPLGNDHRDVNAEIMREVNMLRLGPAACPY